MNDLSPGVATGLIAVAVLATLALCVLVGAIIEVVRHSRLQKRIRQRVVRVSHHGRMVAVRADLQGKHRAHCLCYGCERFYNSANPCPIAQATFDNCVKFGTVTPVWECPDYEAQGRRLPTRR